MPRGHLLEPAEDAQKRRLAAARRADDDEERAFGDVDRDVLDRVQAAEMLVQVADADFHRRAAPGQVSAFHGMSHRSSSLRPKVITKPMIAITNRPTYMRSTEKVSHALQIM